jgi:hypothetical protein
LENCPFLIFNFTDLNNQFLEGMNLIVYEYYAKNASGIASNGLGNLTLVMN